MNHFKLHSPFAPTGDQPQAIAARNLYWIGGCPAGGKTTVAGKLSEATGIVVYHTDDHAATYASRLNPHEHPNIYRINHSNFDELICMMADDIWLNMFISGMRELCPIILNDVSKLYSSNNAIIEGGELLPEFMSELGIVNHVICINPTYEYLREYLPKQKWVQRILASLHDDAYKAVFTERLVFKYNLYREYLLDSAEKHHIKTICTAAPSALGNNMKIISQHFSL